MFSSKVPKAGQNTAASAGFAALVAVGQGGAGGFSALDAGSGAAAFTPIENSGDPSAADHLQPAQERTASIEQEAYEKGFAQGEKDGLEMGETRASKMIEGIEQLLEEMAALPEQMAKRHERAIVDMVFAIARKVVLTQLQFDEKAVGEAVMSALALVSEKNEITLKINPEDFDYVEKLRPDCFAKFKDLKTVMITPDPGVSRGGCVLETPGGDIDADIETQLDKIYQSLREAYTG